MPRTLRAQNDDPAKREEVAFLIPFFGVVVLMPPILNLFVIDESHFGLPLEAIYLFSIWIALILGAVILSRLRSFRSRQPDTAAETRSDAAEPFGGG